MYIQYTGDNVLAVVDWMGPGFTPRPVQGLHVASRYVRREGSDGIGVVQPGAPGRITRRAFLVLPDGREILVWDYSSQEFDRRPILEISPEDWRSVMDANAFERQIERIRRNARRDEELLRYAANPATLATTGKVVG